MATKKELPIGQTFSNLKLIKETTKEGSSYRRALFLCNCGNTKDINYQNVKRGLTVSCGCKQFDRLVTHGDTGTVIYNRWRGMKSRCNNTNRKQYDRYGGRGISYCPEWEDYENFKSWALSNGFEESLELERIDNDKDYSPENCTWVSRARQMQNRNKIKNTLHKYIGVTKLPSNRWRAGLLKDGKQIYMGIYETELEAAKARDEYIINNKLFNKLNLV